MLKKPGSNSEKENIVCFLFFEFVHDSFQNFVLCVSVVARELLGGVVELLKPRPCWEPDDSLVRLPFLICLLATWARRKIMGRISVKMRTMAK